MMSTLVKEKSVYIKEEDKKEREYREEIMRKRRVICNKINEIEMVYNESSKNKQKIFDNELRTYGKMLVNLSLPRKSIRFLYGKYEGRTYQL